MTVITGTCIDRETNEHRFELRIKGAGGDRQCDLYLDDQESSEGEGLETLQQMDSATPDAGQEFPAFVGAKAGW